MRKTWLMRRPVRRPVSRATTAPSSSSVCRLPFISSSALPCSHELDGFRGGRMAVRRFDDFDVAEVRCRTAAATSRMRSAGPTRIGVIRPEFARLDGAGERRLFAGMRHRGGNRIQSGAPLEKAFVFSRSSFCCRFHAASAVAAGTRAAGPVSFSRKTVSTTARATPYKRG